MFAVQFYLQSFLIFFVLYIILITVHSHSNKPSSMVTAVDSINNTNCGGKQEKREIEFLVFVAVFSSFPIPAGSRPA